MTDRIPPLHGVHGACGATFTDFGGWAMPVEFDSIREEHAAVRGSVGMFDVSHMGEVEVSGPDATTLLDRLTTNDVTTLDPGDSQYAGITNEDGILLDDTVVYRLPDGIEAGTATAALAEFGSGVDGAAASDADALDTDAPDADADAPDADAPDAAASDADAATVDLDATAGDPAYLFVPNAGHDADATDRWIEYRDEHDLDAAVANATTDWAMFAVQGPDATGTMAAALDGVDANSDMDGAAGVLDLSRFRATIATVDGVDCWIARTGYTGEDGFEVLCPAADAEPVWSAFDVQPCGLGARDTLRTEMGFLLSGQDFDPDEEPRTPYEAGIGFVVDLDTAFVGRDALAAQQAEGAPDESFTGVRLLERGVPRGGYAVTDDEGTRIGHLTSGTMSPTLDEPIGLGYLADGDTEPGTTVWVIVRGEGKRAEVVEPPFIDR